MVIKVRCCDCVRFVPDTVGDGGGIGRCRIRDEFMAGRHSRLDQISFLNQLGMSLDNQLVWGGVLYDRLCNHYEAV
ncbi:MAG: hypothetical protein M0R47_17000 [Methylobacter sp.]|uniref:hypothetical protein n=1 Tax=Methylobacter sp. TaxID=2051955 RepID=UPI0025EEBB5F|nr:hypothetical protein [Methylobacter sp.]MCK9622222.1 hypothetical protein [Methylobacter sp.]